MMDVVFNHTLLPLAMDNYTVCGFGGVECMSDRGNYSTLIAADVVMVDYQVIPKGGQEGEIIKSLRESGFLKDNEGRREFNRYFSRLMFNPSRELIKAIRMERRRIGLAENQIGAHIRCGGNLANTREGVAMVTPEILATIPQRLIRMANETSIPMNDLFFFISTDSSIAITNLTNALSPIPVRYSALYNRGHSEVIRFKQTGIQQTLIDLFLVAESKALLITSSSAFSRAASWMSKTNHEEAIQTQYSYLHHNAWLVCYRTETCLQELKQTRLIAEAYCIIPSLHHYITVAIIVITMIQSIWSIMHPVLKRFRH